MMVDVEDGGGGGAADANAAYLAQLNLRLRRGCTAHVDPEGRLYYMKKEARKVSDLLGAASRLNRRISERKQRSNGNGANGHCANATTRGPKSG
ncbi:hypothetical protein IscW_ISCW002231 [Ixodes scapularis]|uniref:Uncharacterized protein n=1 Tax=Ixodes scapularis TaxID=6945 RepID=B7P892_IXOSC|nr:hypothetical protein IscW_ISCW002231 [Ixodes scapularis]|eukprot:XP_002401628.1 hypothetical protein IscW_ISCW002231 [Ixodes scapularis]